MFADDLVLIAEDQIRLQEMVSNLDQQCKNYGVRISRNKTEVMVTSREPIQCDIADFPSDHIILEWKTSLDTRGQDYKRFSSMSRC